MCVYMYINVVYVTFHESFNCAYRSFVIISCTYSHTLIFINSDNMSYVIISFVYEDNKVYS